MSPQRRPRGIASRFFLAQLLVVGVSILAAVVVASLAGPPIFHQHLIMAGRPENSPELLHVEQAYRDTNLITLGVALGTALLGWQPDRDRMVPAGSQLGNEPMPLPRVASSTRKKR